MAVCSVLFQKLHTDFKVKRGREVRDFSEQPVELTKTLATRTTAQHS